jgi:formate hydrogenlyase subunit 6/NADH:ubiquinone oxidoreductase subunit I
MGMMAQGVLQTGDPIIRQISEEEAIKMTKEASEIGLVHLTENRNANNFILCACCECCCGMLKGLTKFDNPRAIAKANYIPKIDDDTCIACGTCVDRCKFDAISVNDIAEVTEKRCIGCGLCAVTCPNDAIKMIRIERENIPDRKLPF